MSTNTKRTSLLLLLFSLHLSFWGQNEGYENKKRACDSICIPLNFRFDDAVVLSDYRGNALSLAQFDTLFDADNLHRIEQITIYGSSSPEGASLHNERLARRRATSLSNFFRWKYPQLPPGKVTVTAAAKDRKQEFYEMVQADTSIPQHEEVLKRLAATAHTSASLSGRMFSDESYQYMQRRIFPFFRSAISCVVYFKAAQGEPASIAPDTVPVRRVEERRIEERRIEERSIEERSIEKPIVDTPAPTDSIEQKTPEQAKAVSDLPPFDNRIVVRRPLFAVKTNLLFDLATVLNVEVEVPIGKRWSVAGEWIFPWWLWEKKQHCLQVLSGNLEGRYWLGDRSRHKVLTGWFGGVYAGGGLYDLEWDAKGFQGEFFIAMGVSAGYAHSIGRNLSMEYSLGVGYLKTDYRKYDARFGKDEEWHLIRQSNGSFSWFGPTRAKVSLVWTPQFKFYKKGGATK